MLCVNHTSFLWYASLSKLNSIKAHWERGLTPFSSERLVSLPPQADHVLVELFSSTVAGRLYGRTTPPRMFQNLILFYNYINQGCVRSVVSIPVPSILFPPSRQVFFKVLVSSFHCSFFKGFILFIFRQREKEGERERNINAWLPLMHPQLGTWCAT